MVQGTKVNADEAEAAIEGEGERASERQQDEVGRGRTVWGEVGDFPCRVQSGEKACQSRRNDELAVHLFVHRVVGDVSWF